MKLSSGNFVQLWNEGFEEELESLRLGCTSSGAGSYVHLISGKYIPAQKTLRFASSCISHTEWPFILFILLIYMKQFDKSDCIEVAFLNNIFLFPGLKPTEAAKSTSSEKEKTTVAMSTVDTTAVTMPTRVITPPSTSHSTKTCSPCQIAKGRKKLYCISDFGK